MQVNQNRNIKSASTRYRLTPTYYHHDIFAQSVDKNRLPQVRDTPTFHSTVFESTVTHQISNASLQTKKKQIPRLPINDIVPYSNTSKLRKQAQLNYGSYFAVDDVNAVQDEKLRMYEEINRMPGYTSRIRKCVQQMSNPIFGGFICQPFNRSKLNDKNLQAQQKQLKNTQIEQIQCSQKQKNTELVSNTDLNTKPAIKVSQSKQKTVQQTIKNQSKTKPKSSTVSKLKSTPNLHSKKQKK